MKDHKILMHVHTNQKQAEAKLISTVIKLFSRKAGKITVLL